jgi:hypothetical protein
MLDADTGVLAIYIALLASTDVSVYVAAVHPAIADRSC